MGSPKELAKKLTMESTIKSTIESTMDSITESIMDGYSILWADLMALKRRGIRFLITTLVSPLLYLVAFGWGWAEG